MLSLCASEPAFQCFFVFSDSTNVPLLDHQVVVLNTVQSCRVPEDVFIISNSSAHIHKREKHEHMINSFGLNQTIFSLKHSHQEEHFFSVQQINSEGKKSVSQNLDRFNQSY